MELSFEQKSAVESDSKKVLIVSAAGVGKTRVLTERAKYLLNHGVNPQKLVLITYTNNAAQEMKDRLVDCAGFEKVAMSTIHSYAAQLLAMNRINIDGLLERARIDDDFDRLFDEVRKNLGQIYIPEIDHLLIDEFQDVAPQEYKFIKTILKPHHLFAVGDPRQMIYSFKGSSKDVFDSLYNDPETQIYELTENYRSKAGILKTAQQTIRDLPEAAITDVVPMREGKADISTIPFDLEEVVDILKEDGNYKDWFVLARTNKLIGEIAATFDKYKIPYTNFRQAEKTTEEIKQLMSSDVVKLLTIHSAKGLEAKNVILFENYLGGASWSQEDRDEERRIRYVGITRAEDRLVLVKRPRKNSRRSGYGGGFGGFGF